MKKSVLSFVFTFASVFLIAEGSSNQKKFVKGNIADKTESVKAASENEVVDLAKAAIEFSINYKEILGNDRELSALAVSGVFSIPDSYIQSTTFSEKSLLEQKFMALYDMYDDETVKIAVLNKFYSSELPTSKFVEVLNKSLITDEQKQNSAALKKEEIKTLGNIGNEESFDVLYKLYASTEWKEFNTDLFNSVSLLANKAEKHILSLIQNGNVSDVRRIFDVVEKNTDNTQIFRAEIAENILSRAIFIYENSTSPVSEDLILLQMDSYNVLRNLKWTRASDTISKFLKTARNEYEEGIMKESDFISVINGIPYLAPIACVQSLSLYLTVLNKKMESKSFPSEPLVLAIINSLGAIGDKNAFDSLLGVTYYEYSDSVVAAARQALAKLKW